MPERRRTANAPRKTLFDTLAGVSANAYCSLTDLSNEASVEAFFVQRMLEDLGYRDAQIKTKKSLSALVVARGSKRQKYKPDYALFIDSTPRCIVDAKAVDEDIDAWVEQCSGYCLSLNRRFTSANPVRYFVLSNGKTTKIYEWDRDEPLLVLDFADFMPGNAKYWQLRALLAADTVAADRARPASHEPSAFTFVRATSERARQLFVTCHKAIWKSEICSPSAAFMEFVKVMFVKLWADRLLREQEATKAHFTPQHDTVQLPSSEVRFSVQWIEAQEREGVTNPIATVLFRRLRDDIERGIHLRKKKRIFDKEQEINLKPSTMKQVVRRLEHFDLFGIDEDLNGRLFETFLSATMRGRELGQFFTPRSVVKMMTNIGDLQATPRRQTKVIDACCGSGGFLIEALAVMRNQVRANPSLSPDQRNDLLAKVCNDCLYGIDFGKDPPLARIARINMYLHGDGGSRIYYADALDKKLAPTQDEDPELLQNRDELRDALATGRFDVALTNPPFSMTKEAKNDEERFVLSQYDLARKDQTSHGLRPSLRSSVMFVERYWDLLRHGGHLVTVIDDTVLASEQFRDVRTFIRKRFLIRAIISLPGDAFRRSGSRVKTSVLVLQKKKNATDQQPACFGFFSESLGVDDLTPRASDADISAARGRADAEIEAICSGYAAFLTGKKTALTIPPSRLADRLDLKYCAGEYGRMAGEWQSRGAEVKKLSEVVTPVEDLVIPANYPNADFTLLKVTYGGRCETERVRKGRAIKARRMYRVRAGQLVFSTIRATDGAIGIVPNEHDGALVSGSYTVFRCKNATDTAYLWAVLRSHEIRADMQSQSPGSGRYTTYWPEIGDLRIPWLPANERKAMGKSLLDSWRMERRVDAKREKALQAIAELGLESEASRKRFNAAKAPT